MSNGQVALTGGRLAAFSIFVSSVFVANPLACLAATPNAVEVGGNSQPAAVGLDSAQSGPQVKLIQAALQAAAAGKDELRQQLATEALRSAPDDPRVHWLNGELQFQGRWRSALNTGDAAAVNPTLTEYLRRREKVGSNAAEQFALGQWCREHGLADEARSHLQRTLELQPDHQGAIQLLQLRLNNGTWMTRNEIASQEKFLADSKRNLRKWQPHIAAIVRRLSSPSTSAEATSELTTITDPTAVPALEATLVSAGSKLATPVVDTLRRMPQQSATEAMLRGAVLTRNEEVRKLASTALKQRPIHDYVPLLLAGLTPPTTTTVEVQTSGREAVIREVVTREGDDIDQQVVHQAHVGYATPNVRLSFFMRDALEQVSQSAERTQRKLDKARQRDDNMNQRIVSVLKYTTGEDFGSQPRLWWDWWQDYNDTYASPYRPVSVQQYNYEYDVPYQMPGNSYPYYRPRTSCFAKGTPVWTFTGLRSIDEIEIGDKVLSQDPDTGELAYKVVLTTTLRRDRPMVTIVAGGDAITSTRGHVFWVAGEGWRMAKELAAGHKLQGMLQSIPINRIEPAEIGDAYNLVVADFGTYFVGDNQLLVHDTTPQKPTLARVPGLVAKD